jgi:hypothetical protein
MSGFAFGGHNILLSERKEPIVRIPEQMTACIMRST